MQRRCWTGEFQISNRGGGPDDVIDLHTETVGERSESGLAKKAGAHANEGWLIAIELMSNLVDCYRGREVTATERV